MNSKKTAMQVLKETSRTFYIPISRLPKGLLEAVASAYLCMRAIDEIEDHPTMETALKAKLLRDIAFRLQTGRENTTAESFCLDFKMYPELPEVSTRIAEWAMFAPISIAPRIWDATSSMADRMAYWAENKWSIQTEADLDSYTYSVAGCVGVMLSDLWAWYDGTKTDRILALGYGRGLQAVNILRNLKEDKQRGVSFLPFDWKKEDLVAYIQRNLALGDQYTDSLPTGPVSDFCKIPLTLAHATVKVLSLGKSKLSRNEVNSLVEQVTSTTGQ